VENTLLANLDKLHTTEFVQLTDSDGNVIEVTGAYTPKDGKFDG
jgi:major membrane immunogen (membrane-anchored lipoprotein)